MTANKRKNRYTIAFYNVENLFDTVDNPNTFDDDFTPNGKLRWNRKKYGHKLRKITSVISQLGNNQSAYPPVIIGLVEVENAIVVNNLVKHKNLSRFNYDYVHYDSPDERGIDVALMYNKDFFKVIFSETHSLLLNDEEGGVDYTRDLLVVKGMLNDEIVYVLVNHWPSRREGVSETENNRIKAAQLTRSVMDKIKEEESTAKFIIMGDFNDNPVNKSVEEYLMSDDLYNPMKPLYKRGKGTTTHFKEWHLFDQIMFSRDFFDEKKSKYTFLDAKIYNRDWLKIFNGKYEGSPFRTFIGPFYKGGFSDHFPVYITLEKDR
ncbi:endonuclease/exonuclease/phosphatase family protein [Tenacibaculum sp. SSH1-16]|uniref:Endonuclease n=1 Tax=Tenacibaculum sp. Pbs-1 TaxID=3238748 RepID=A0AB33L6M4_9FLAO|nr:endonuclease [Tenacibaculum mesophilum]GFD72437.1 endonuclease [Tenacibaculum sp. KUL113]|eukprot:TRINITY_DN12360_c0_g1_i7.p1 TRINITY_DN12360_c0_g1~~TRINITY_DN12360_c0_g1_i7.p1  ORF type:complete len:320 (+),score=44.42 TRINITY_DN12360_c0_g1_i7:204-1163(+)